MEQLTTPLLMLLIVLVAISSALLLYSLIKQRRLLSLPPNHITHHSRFRVGSVIRTFGLGWDYPGIEYIVTRKEETWFRAEGKGYTILHNYKTLKDPKHLMGDKYIELVKY